MNDSPKNIDRLNLFKNRTKIGTLERTKRGYSIEFTSEQFGKDITYHIRATPSPLVENGVNLPPYFANLLPEGLRLKALVRSIKTSEDDLFSLFAAAGTDSIGDLTTESSFQKETSQVVLKKINFYEAFNQNIRNGVSDAIAGVQEKISASMISFPVSIQKKQKLHILKLNPKDKPDLIKNEFFTLALAKQCGLKVATARLVSDKDDNAGLLVERFDRSWDAEKNQFNFIHQEDGCQILNLYPSQKYRISINDLTQKIADLGAAPQIDVLTLIRQVAFSYLVGNGDLHAKNISLYDPPGEPRQLTPAYDLICTLPYGDIKQAMKLDGFDDNLKLKLLVDFGTRFQIPKAACEVTLKKLVMKFSNHCAQFIDSLEVTEKMRAHLERTFKKRLADLGA